MPPKSWKWQLLGPIGQYRVYQFKSWFKDGKDEQLFCWSMEELCAMIIMCFVCFVDSWGDIIVL